MSRCTIGFAARQRRRLGEPPILASSAARSPGQQTQLPAGPPLPVQGMAGRRRRDCLRRLRRLHQSRLRLVTSALGAVGERPLERRGVRRGEARGERAKTFGELWQRPAALELADDHAQRREPLVVPRHRTGPGDRRGISRVALDALAEIAHDPAPRRVHGQRDVVQRRHPRPAGGAPVRPGQRRERRVVGEQLLAQGRVGGEERVHRRARPDRDEAAAGRLAARAPLRPRPLMSYDLRPDISLAKPSSSGRDRGSRACVVSCRSRPAPAAPGGHAMSIVTFNNVEKSFAGPAPVHDRVVLRRRARPRRARGPQRHRQDDAAPPRLRRRARRLGHDRARPRPQDLAARADAGARARPPGARLPRSRRSARPSSSRRRCAPPRSASPASPSTAPSCATR